MFSLFQKNFYFSISICLTAVFLVLSLKNIAAITFHDPTRPPGIPTVFKPVIKNYALRWRLSSTLISSDRKFATINGKLLYQGDFVDGAVLIDIQSLSVTLRKNNKKFKVYMFDRKVIRK